MLCFSLADVYNPSIFECDTDSGTILTVRARRRASADIIACTSDTSVNWQLSHAIVAFVAGRSVGRR